MTNATTLDPKLIIANSVLSQNPNDLDNNGIFERFGFSGLPFYFDRCCIDINGFKICHPLNMPIVNGHLELIQCAVLENGKRVQVIPDGIAHGFAYYGKLKKDQPVIVTFGLEAFFKVAQTGYAVVLVILPHLCSSHLPELGKADFKQVEQCIQQLDQAGYEYIYLTIRPEHKRLIEDIERNTHARIIDQYTHDYSIDLSQYDLKEEVLYFLDQAIVLNHGIVDVWEEPLKIKSELLPVKPLTSDMLPLDLDVYCRDEAKRADNMTPDFVAVCLLTSLGALIGARVAIKPKQLDDYALVPNLWGGIIAPPSSKKSPAIKAGTRHLDSLVIQAQEQFKEAKAESFANDLVVKATEKELSKQLTKATSDEVRKKIALDIARLQEDATRLPVLKRYFTNDSTPEALAELERSNPNGILVVRDELVGWLSSLDQNDTDTGRAFYLEAWNGTGTYQFDRVMRGSGLIENHCLSVLGGIQPDKLMSYLEKTIKGLGNDGLLQRFQLLIYPDVYDWQYVDQASDKEARNAVFSLFKAIDELNEYELVRLGAKPTDEFNNRPYFRFTSEAQELYKAWSENINGQIIPNEEHSIIQEHLTKYGKLMPSLALIFHLVDGVQLGSRLGGISKRSTEMAIQWCEYLESHARRIYGLILQASTFKAGLLAKKLKVLNESDLWRLNGFKARDIHRKNWKSLTDINSVNEALDILVDYHWLRVQEIESTIKGGRPTVMYRINPKIFKLI